MSAPAHKSNDENRLSRDEIFHILSNKRRRFILEYLRRTEEPVGLIDLAKSVAAWENDKPREELTVDERRRMYVSLYQSHVPKLSSAGLVDYDTDEQTVASGDTITQIEPYLAGRRTGPDWYLYYLLVAVFDIGLLSASVTPFPGLWPLENVLLVVAVSFLLLASVHFVVERKKKGWNPGRSMNEAYN
ncbi:DUF7344 domain-containing protein [Haloarcula rubra]